jgi:outer membrane cobalamin receptor
MVHRSVRLILPIFASALLLFSNVFSQIQTDKANLTDTTLVNLPDSLQSKPTLISHTLGFVDGTIPVFLKDSAINFSNYRLVPDLLANYPGIFIKEFGGLGHIPDIRLNGTSPRQIQISNDGIQLNDPWTGLYNLFLYPAENIEQIEIIDGTRAFLYGFNSTGGIINFISKSKRAIKPYSRLRYSESGYGFSIIDGVLSQNITRNLNATAGVQHSVFGERFTNESFDGWNGRLKLRYDLSNTFNIYVSEIYNKYYLGLPGGININATPDSLRFDNLQAVVNNSDAYEKISRHDFQAGIAAFPFEDSTAVNSLTFYISSNLREYRDEENRYGSNGIFIQQNQRAQWMGVKMSSNFSFGFQRITIGADIQSQRTLIAPSTREERAGLLSAFGKSEIQISKTLILSPYARLDSYLGERPVSYGGDLNFEPTDGLKLFTGYSRSFRFPSLIERHGIDTIVTSSLTDGKPERHHLMDAGIRWSKWNWLNINLKSFYRIVWNPVTTDIIDYSPNLKRAYVRHNKQTIEGITFGMTLHASVILLEGSAQYIKERDEQSYSNITPIWGFIGGVYYRDNLFRGHLELQAGIRATAFGAYRSDEFNEQIIDYLPTDPYVEINSNSIFDIVILAHIGDAYFHIILDNILDTQLVMNNFYPIHDRRLRFGVSWEFLD